MTQPTLPALILASTSAYRRELLTRLRLPYTCEAPGVDEAARPDEAPLQTALRLAAAKAQAVALRHPHAVVIGSDQVADLDGQALGKPGTHERASAQLHRMSGTTVVFHTAVAVVRADRNFAQTEVASVSVRFRHLSDARIEAYLQAERPYDCAGSAKSEGLGIALLTQVASDDPTALIGLPLTRVCTLLEAAGLPVLPA